MFKRKTIKKVGPRSAIFNRRLLSNTINENLDYQNHRSKIWNLRPNTIYVGYQSKIIEDDFDSQKNYKSHQNISKVKTQKMPEEKSKYCSDIERKTYFELIKIGGKHLCENGTLHGFKYMTDVSKMRGEKCIWLAIISISLAFCFAIIHTLWTKWSSVPFTLVMDDDYTPIYDIPFPSIVICPENTVKMSYINLSQETDRIILFAASLVCGKMLPAKYSLPDGTSSDEDGKIMDFIEKSTPKCSDVIKSCNWVTSNEKRFDTFDCCSEYFQPFMTNNGVCFGFNMITHLSNAIRDKILKNNSIKVWSPGAGYTVAPNQGYTPYPRRVYTVGENIGLTVELYVNTSDTQEFCDGLDNGFKISMGCPLESVFGKSLGNIPMEKQTTFAIIPKKVSSDIAIRNISPKTRKCYFNNEKRLQYFDFYTQYNCILECELKYMIAICKCVPYFHKPKMTDVPICKTYKNYLCFYKIKAQVGVRMIENYYATKRDSDFTENDRATEDGIYWCECYPGCTELSYNMEVFYSDLQISDISEPSWANFTVKRHELTRFDAHFKESLFLGFHRKVLYDTMDFLGSTGGVLSLFLGFSIMSLIEFFYYIILQPIILWFKIRLSIRDTSRKNINFIK